MQLLQHIHSHHIVTALYAAVLIWFIIKNGSFVRGALSEGNSPSSLRLTGFIVFLTCCTAFVFDTARNGLDIHKFLYMILSGGALYGLIKAAQILALKGVKDPTEGKKEGE